MWHVWGNEEVHTGIWSGDQKGKKPLGSPRRKLEDAKWNFRYKGMDWIDLARDWDVVNTAMNIRVP